MTRSNFAELRRVRSEMSAIADHDVHRYVALMSTFREKYRDRLVNHGAETEQDVARESVGKRSADGQSSPDGP